MGKVELAYVNSFTDRHGRTRYYFRKGRKRTALPAPTSEAFNEEYTALLAEHAPQLILRQGRAVPVLTGTLGWVIQKFKDESPEWKAAAESTRIVYNRRLDWLREKYGKAEFASIDEEGVRNIRNELKEFPSVADGVVDWIGRLWRYAKEHIKELGKLGPNPANEVASLHKKHVSHPIWPPALVEALEHHPNPMVRRAYFLIRYTGQRRSDVVKMRDTHFDGSAIEVVQQKTGTYCWIPCHTRLREHFAQDGIRDGYLLANSYGNPYKGTSLTNLICATCTALGFPGYSPHGGRHLAGSALAEAGCSLHEIMSILGHLTEAEAAVYVRQAQRKVMAKSAIRKLEGGN
jgi:integrase